MEASSIRKIGGKTLKDVLSNRRATIAIAVGAAILAGILLFAFVQQYRKSVNTTASSTPVFVASGYIPRGTSTAVIASGKLMQRTQVKSNEALQGAIADPSAIHGEVTATDIYPGQQLTAADFTAQGVTIGSELTGQNRAIAVSVDSTHGLTGFVQAGDHVDVLSSVGASGAAHGEVNVVAQNVLVLSAPGAGSGSALNGSTSSSGNIVLRVNRQVARELAFDNDNGKVWITLRPATGAIDSTPAGG